jgi:hypothetical protein
VSLIKQRRGKCKKKVKKKKFKNTVRRAQKYGERRTNLSAGAGNAVVSTSGFLRPPRELMFNEGREKVNNSTATGARVYVRVYAYEYQTRRKK